MVSELSALTEHNFQVHFRFCAKQQCVICMKFTWILYRAHYTENVSIPTKKNQCNWLIYAAAAVIVYFIRHRCEEKIQIFSQMFSLFDFNWHSILLKYIYCNILMRLIIPGSRFHIIYFTLVTQPAIQMRRSLRSNTIGTQQITCDMKIQINQIRLDKWKRKIWKTLNLEKDT